MKTLETKNGQIFEIFTSAKEAIQWIQYYDFEDMQDDTIYVEYFNGKKFFAGWNGEVEGTFKKTGIKTAIIQNACTTQVYGQYRIYNMDDIEEEYSEENDSEYKDWNVE